LTVGIFSFLSGKKDEPAAETPPATGTTSGNIAPAETNGAPHVGASSEPAPAPAPAPQTPFTPPEAWNVDALTAPHPEPIGETPQIGAIDRAVTADLQPKVVEVLKTVFDPEIPVDIYELGLIYEIIADAERKVLVRMTLTSPACPSAQQIPSEVRYKVKAVPDVKEAWVEIVWEPPWSKDRMSEAAKLSLGFF
jgi:FeS assembly SUF system protein